MKFCRQGMSSKARQFGRWLVLVALLSGCSVAGPDSLCGFEYPLEVGNRWEYEREFWMSDIDPVKGESEKLDSIITSHVDIWVDEEVVLPDSVLAMPMLETITEGEDTYESAHFYANAQEGMYLHAYVPGSSAVAPKAAQGAGLWFGDLCVRGPSDILRLVQGELLFAGSLRETLFYEEPTLVLPNPMRVGDQWTVREPGDPCRVDKRVSGLERVEVPAGAFTCYVVEWLIDHDDDGNWDDEAEFCDHISRAGLVRRSLRLEMIAMSAEGETLGVFEVTDISELSSLDLSLEYVGQAN